MLYLHEFDENNWFVNGVNISRSCPPIQRPATCIAHWIDDTDHSSYTVTERLEPPPPDNERRVPTSRHITHHPLDHAFLVSSAIGSKVILRQEQIGEVTPEHRSLEFVRSKQPQTFGLPELLYHWGKDGHHYSFTTLPGRLLNEAWPTLSAEWRRHYIRAIVDALDEMTSWKGTDVEGVDGSNVAQPVLSNDLDRCGSHGRYKLYHKVRADVKAMGLDTETPVFYHGNPDAFAICVEDQPQTGKIWFINWERAGYYPPEFIRSHITLGSQLYVIDFNARTCDHSLQRGVAKILKSRGYGECHLKLIRFGDYWENYLPRTREDLEAGDWPSTW